MMANVSFEVQVYAKLFLHAAKYPSEIIFGFLLGHSLQEGRIIIDDLLPVCHSHPSSLLLETCCLVTEKICEKKKDTGSKILGVYFANAAVGDVNVPNYVQEISSTLQAQGVSNLVFQIKNHLLAEKEDLFVQVESKGKQLVCEILGSKSLKVINEQLDSLLDRKVQYKFADFEDHMNDNGVSDFRNTSLMLSI